ETAIVVKHFLIVVFATLREKFSNRGACERIYAPKLSVETTEVYHIIAYNCGAVHPHGQPDFPDYLTVGFSQAIEGMCIRGAEVNMLPVNYRRCNHPAPPFFHVPFAPSCFCVQGIHVEVAAAEIYGFPADGSPFLNFTIGEIEVTYGFELP